MPSLACMACSSACCCAGLRPNVSASSGSLTGLAMAQPLGVGFQLRHLGLVGVLDGSEIRIEPPLQLLGLAGEHQLDLGGALVELVGGADAGAMQRVADAGRDALVLADLLAQRARHGARLVD